MNSFIRPFAQTGSRSQQRTPTSNRHKTRSTLFAAFAAFLSAFAGCDQKTAKPAPPPSVRLDGADLKAADKFGRELAESIASGNPEKVGAMCDFEALWSVVVQHLDSPGRILAGTKSGFLSSTQKQPGGLFREAMGKEVRMLRVRERAGETVLLMRMRDDKSAGAAYMDVFLTRGGDGTFRARDIFNYALGENVSDVIGRLLAQGLAASSQTPLEKILKGKGGAPGGLTQAMKIAETLRAGKFAEVLTQSDALPAATRKERFVQFMRVQAAMGLNDDARYLKVLDEMAAAFPNDPSLSFTLLDRHVLKNDFAKALDALKLLLADLGNDAFLANIHATCLQELGRMDDASEAIVSGLKVEPGDRGLMWSHVAVLGKLRRYADLVKVLDEILKLHNEVADPKKAEETGLTEFFASPDGKAYVARMKEGGLL